MKAYLNYLGCAVLAHRGGSLESYENTLQSFEYSRSIGCKYIETDVQVTSDGVPYIFHDESLKRIVGDDILFSQLTAKEIDKIKGKQSKEIILNTFMQQHQLTSSNTLAVGDGANDSAMIKATNLGVAFRAKETLKKDTIFHIDHSDLTALLYLQGYKEDEFRQLI